MPSGGLRALRRAPWTLLAIAALLMSLTGVPRAHATTPVGASATLALASNPAIVTPGAAVDIGMELINPSAESVSAGSVALSLSPTPLSNPAAVADWIAGGPSAGAVVARSSLLPTPAGGTSTTSVTLPAATFPSEGVWGVQGGFTSGATSFTARTVVTISSAVIPAEVSTIVALTAHAPAVGLYDAETLASLTGPDGELTVALQAVLGQPVTVGVDPRIAASVLALGANAPASAIAWLNTLETSGLDRFALQFGDADPALQAQLGLQALLEPGSLADTGVTETSTTPLSPLARSIVWPNANTVSSANLPLFRSAGYQSIVLGSGNVAGDAGPLTTVDGMSAFISADAPSAALARALQARSSTQWLSAVNVLQAELAQLGGQRIVLAPDRVAPADLARARSTFTLLANSAVSRGVPLGSLTLAGSATVIDHTESAERLATGAHVLERAAALNAFAAVASDPASLTGPTQRDVLALFAVGWQQDAPGWLGAVGGFDADIATTLNAVRVSSSSTINVLASEASLPISIENDLDVPVTVWVSVSPSNGRVVVGAPIEATLAAHSHQTVQIPVKARIGNGSVALTVRLLNASGGTVSTPTVIAANVQADWEGWGAAIIALLAAGLFTFGVVRQVRKIRRQRSQAASE